MRRIIPVVLSLIAVFSSPAPMLAQATGPTFYYVVTTVDVNGFQSAYSNQATATFSVGQHQAVLTWVAATVPTGGAAIAGYNVYRGTVSGGPYTKINTALVTTVAGGVPTYTDPFVVPNAPTGLAETTN